MKRAIVVASTMDTKGDLLQYFCEQLEADGHPTITIDIGAAGEVPFEPTYNRDKVAEAAGVDLEDLILLIERSYTVNKLAQGAINIVQGLHSKDRINGIVVASGSQGTAIALEIVKSLPIGFPKMAISTIANSTTITPDSVEGDDIMMVPWLAGLYGLNCIVKHTLNVAAGAIAGAAMKYDSRPALNKKIAGVTSLGPVIFPSLKNIKSAIESRGWEAAVFQVNGMSGRSYERVIKSGLIRISLDLNGGVELLNEMNGGIFSAGVNRLEAAGRAGIPQIVSPGCIQTFHWGNDRPLPDKYKNRVRIWHTTLVLSVLSSVEENARLGSIMAAKLNNAEGPTVVVLPMRGNADRGMPVPKEMPPLPENPEVKLTQFVPYFLRIGIDGMRAYRDALKEKINSNIEVVELDVGYNEPVYIKKVIELFDELRPKD